MFPFFANCRVSKQKEKNNTTKFPKDRNNLSYFENAKVKNFHFVSINPLFYRAQIGRHKYGYKKYHKTIGTYGNFRHRSAVFITANRLCRTNRLSNARTCLRSRSMQSNFSRERRCRGAGKIYAGSAAFSGRIDRRRFAGKIKVFVFRFRFLFARRNLAVNFTFARTTD
jgi:hypothetical protein